jgi:UDP-N-acetylglucosamine--N-acetylmuramyl-(pentapeptide) pyrophosphoryl-undecaprenol N-acetylglucosamine transferase
VPGGGLPARADPAGAAAPSTGVDLLRTPGGCAGPEGRARGARPVQPDVVVGFGGYVSVPAYLARRKRQLPLVVHEGNALPGIANKLGARFTTTSPPASRTPTAGTRDYIGLPIRRMIQNPSTVRRCGPRGVRLLRARPAGPPLLVTGGSQGRPAAEPVRGRGRARLRGGRGAGAAHRGSAWGEASPETTPGGPPYVHGGPFVSRMDLAYPPPDAVSARARQQHPSRRCRASACRPSS